PGTTRRRDTSSPCSFHDARDHGQVPLDRDCPPLVDPYGPRPHEFVPRTRYQKPVFTGGTAASAREVVSSTQLTHVSRPPPTGRPDVVPRSTWSAVPVPEACATELQLRVTRSAAIPRPPTSGGFAKAPGSRTLQSAPLSTPSPSASAGPSWLRS